MAEPRMHQDSPEQYSETRDPRNPPNSVLQPEVRKATTRSFLLPLVVLTLIAGLLWVFWLGRGPDTRNAEETGAPTSTVGTSGEEPGRGGFDTTPNHGDTKDEIEFRGGNEDRK